MSTGRTGEGSFREEWAALSVYERFEQGVVLVLTGLIMIVVVLALWSLMREVAANLLSGVFDPLDYATFQSVFGAIFTVVIALEFKRSLLVVMERRFGIVQVRSVVLIAQLAIVRKFIIVDLGSAEPTRIFALAFGVLALGAVYWLVRDQDLRECGAEPR